jgi:hypothetical protein
VLGETIKKNSNNSIIHHETESTSSHCLVSEETKSCDSIVHPREKNHELDHAKCEGIFAVNKEIL